VCSLHNPDPNKNLERFNQTLWEKIGREEADDIFPEINLSGVVFPADADFSGRVFQKPVNFDGAQFGSAADFKGVHFDEGAFFMEARFGGTTSFEDARFGGEAVFSHTQFGGEAVFWDVRFGGLASFFGTMLPPQHSEAEVPFLTWRRRAPITSGWRRWTFPGCPSLAPT
jgi:hypothetical protein